MKFYINGKVYNNLQEAANEFKIPRHSVMARIKSTRAVWVDWTTVKPKRKRTKK